MRCRLFTLLLLSTCAISQTLDPTPVDGRISGTVVNEDGKPVPGATVYVSEEASSLVDANSVAARTDSGGRFDFGRKLKHGVYEIYSRKEKDGYPDPTSKFYQPLNFSPQKVQLFGDHPAEKVTVQLQEKAAILAGKVFDANTGQPLKAGIGFTKLRTQAGHFVLADGKFRALIPADTDVYVMVQEVGRDHADWALFTTKVTLKPGQKMDIEVPLSETATPSDTPE
ncbi:MAG TPA: carboxypeptidase-like regulatory domain-containing protein [Candidatus Polarisedimenticolia bacterium]|nr:carboxypeptidase-like regulatory domain-containing protein [Candidatus Polarisedimenticolia bacterium]